jgi:hypothetical protein
MEVQMGNMEWAHLPRTEIWLKGALEVECLSVGALLREPVGRASLLETLKDM